MPAICQTQGFPARVRHHWLVAVCATALVSGCAPLPTDPAADAPASSSTPTAVPAAPARTAAAAPGAPARPSGRWSWLRHERDSAAQAASSSRPTPPDAGTEAAPEPRDSDQQGMASWYGPGLHGRRTANGERFDSSELTAAHPSLAFGTRVCVRSAVTGKSVVVRINDRGPFAKGRVIDLSRAAAEELGMVGLGIKPVELWALSNGESQCPGDAMDSDQDPVIAGLSEAARQALHAHRNGQKKPAARRTAAKTVKKKK